MKAAQNPSSQPKIDGELRTGAMVRENPTSTRSLVPFPHERMRALGKSITRILSADAPTPWVFF